ncbi:uncharacterized protein LOC133290408 [Gastrolobium bilobum]|uniref:uncharacterized protein LOC133290408 n=1 Tax=Gastrolobium bilobum TaxID=150636 RepID=UPI002AB27E9B|nr:uncharacterized protein LOC133290408 [Gastrolobium bilobum]
MEIPSFDGQNPHVWLFKSELFFNMQLIPEEFKIRLAGLKMEGGAASWFQWVHAGGTVQSWDEFAQAVCQRFGGTAYMDLRGVLSKLSQSGSLQDYVKEFEELMNQVPGLDDSMLFSFFVSGLNMELCSVIQVHWPANLQQAMQLAFAYDAYHQELCSPFYGQSKKHRWKNNAHPTSTSSTMLQNNANPSAPLLPTPPSLPIKKLLQEELKKKRELGLCYTCEEKWTMGHRCKSRMLLLIAEPDDDGVEGEEEIVWCPESNNVFPQEGLLNSLSMPSNNQIMQLEEMIRNKMVGVLVDSGSSHNFIQKELALELGIPLVQTKCMKVVLDKVPKELWEVLMKYHRVFEVPRSLPPSSEIDHSIHLIEGSKPVNVKPYRYPHFQKAEIEKQVKELMSTGFIQESKSPYSSPVLNSLQEHIQHLEISLNCLSTHEFFVKLSKCSFAVDEIDYLGHLVSGLGVKSDPAKVAAMVQWPRPQTVKQLRAFLGLTGYYRRFAKGYASIATPLTNLLSQEAWQWSIEAQTDASNSGIGAVLTQKGKPISFFSKKLGPRLAAASTYIKEFTAIIEAVKE